MSPEEYLEHLRELIPGAVYRFTNGDCYKLYEGLRACYPQAVAWYDIVAGHVLTEIDGSFYDITGKVIPPEEHFIPLDYEPNIAAQAPFWAYQPTS